MSILKVEPSAINTDASFVFGDIATTGNITVGDAIIQSTAGGGIEFVTATGTVNLDANTVSFLSNVSTQGLSGSNGYVGSQGVSGFTGSRGDTGLGFAIAKTYSSVAALTADTAPTGIVAGQFALIETGSVDDAENSRLYLWNGSAYSYVSDLSGAAGITGPAGTAGFTGSAGSSGTAGFTGSAGTGFTGSLGYTGSTSEATTVTVSPAFKGALVSANATQTLTAATWTTLTNFGSVLYDTNNFRSVANRFTIPAGVTKVKLSGSLLGESATDQFICRITKNGSPTYSTVVDIDTTGQDASVALTPVVEVVAGDYFEFQGYSSASRSIVASATNWFAIEVVEGSILDTTSVIRTTGFTGSVGQVQYQPGTAVPYILVKTNGSQQSVASGAEVLLNLNTVVSGNVELSNGTDGFNIPRTGLYNIDVGYITNNSTHVDITEIHARIFVNGTNRYSIFESSPAFGFNKSLSGSTDLYLNQGDIVKIYFWAFNDTLIVGASGAYIKVTELLPPSAGFTGSAGTNGFTGSAAPLNLPVVNRSSAYTLTAADVGDYVNITTGGVTVPAGVFVSGDVVSIYNNSASSQTITTTAVTCYLVGTATTGNRTLAQRGLATLLCVGTNEFVISGGGLT
jgi:hypothetical protein